MKDEKSVNTSLDDLKSKVSKMSDSGTKKSIVQEIDKKKKAINSGEVLK